MFTSRKKSHRLGTSRRGMVGDMGMEWPEVTRIDTILMSVLLLSIAVTVTAMPLFKAHLKNGYLL